MLYISAAAALIALDQFVKYRVTETLALYETAPFLPRLIELKYIRNTGAAWSSFAGQRLLLTVLPMLLIAAVLYLLRRYHVRHPLGKWAAALIIAGGIGNLIDRVRLGYVVDMFHFLFWQSYPVFNVADVFVVFGAIFGAVYYLWLYEKYDKPCA